MQFRILKEQILNTSFSENLEYLLANDYGAYSSGTVNGCNTRKYHSLLAVPVKGNLYSLVSAINISAVIAGQEYDLSTNRFPEVYHPEGYKYIESFSYGRYPETIYRINSTEITESRIMLKNRNSVLIKYKVNSEDVYFKIKPFISYRDVHKLSKENTFINKKMENAGKSFYMNPYEGLPNVYFESQGSFSFYCEPNWWNNFEYSREQERGYTFHEDLFCPGYFKLKTEEAVFAVTAGGILNEDPGKLWMNSEKRLKSFSISEPESILKASSKAYLYRDKNQKGIIAGYHWFREWGRDTLISFEGITLCTCDFESALSILKKYTLYEKDGLLPNIISNEGGHAYNSVDSSLLYFHAVQKYLKYTGNKSTVKEYLLDTMINIVVSYLDGRTPVGEIKENGFLYAGTEDTQYTWMDANSSGHPVTPRFGAAVEINALWFNALNFLLSDFNESLKNSLKSKIQSAAAKFKNNFEKLFYCKETGSLLDVYRNKDDFDSAIRPNQLFALGLEHTCISKEAAEKILETVKKHLVTPFGLRTLSPSDPEYKREYSGNQEKRDAAYHQGTVWPWLTGIFCDALFKTYGSRKDVKDYIDSTFRRLWKEHLFENGIFHISEIFEPEEPYKACGCIAQAWSTAEILRVLKMLK